MDRYDRWIVEVAVTLRQPLRTLLQPPEKVLHWFNRAHHGRSPREIVVLLRRLLVDGLIALSPGHDGVLRDDEEELRRLIDVEDRGPFFRSTYYGLTPEGGAAWEAIAHPDWNRYIYESSGTDDTEVICADEARLERYAFSPFHQHNQKTVPGTVSRDRLEPWDATYWKQLPFGHRIRYRYESTEEPCDLTDVRSLEFFRDADHWFSRADE
jgi:hypothetical protein